MSPTRDWSVGKADDPADACTRPCARAARAIPPSPAMTCSPYRIGIRCDFQRPACITDARSMLSANRSCVAPTRTECPLMAWISSAGILICRATLLKTLPMAAALNRAPIRSGIVRNLRSLPGRGGRFGGNPVPINRRNTAPLVTLASSNHSLRYRTVTGARYAVCPSPRIVQKKRIDFRQAATRW
jgi:hypothetical protein